MVIPFKASLPGEPDATLIGMVQFAFGSAVHTLRAAATEVVKVAVTFAFNGPE